MYREVTMIEFKEVLRLWQEQVPKKRIAARLGLDPKTVRRYLWAAEAAGLRAQQETLSDEQVRDVLLALQPGGGRPHGESWARCSEQREAIQRWLASGYGSLRFVSSWRGRVCRSAIPRFTALRSSSCSLGEPPPPSRSSMAIPARNCKWIPAGWAGSPLHYSHSVGAFVLGSLPRSSPAIGLCIPPSKKQRRAPSRPARLPGSSSAASSAC